MTTDLDPQEHTRGAPRHPRWVRFSHWICAVSILTLAQHGLLGNMHSPVDITYLADSVVLLRYYEAKGRLNKAISVVKKRSGYHETAIRELRIENSRVFVGDPLDKFQGVLTGVPKIVATPV